MMNEDPNSKTIETAEDELENLIKLSDDTETLKKNSVSSFGWATVHQITGRVISFTVNLALARLLLPEDFGTLSVLWIFVSIAVTLSDVGFGSSLMRSEKLDDADLSTVFYYNVGMSALTSLILIVAAPWVGDFYHDPALVSVLRVLSLSFVLGSLGSVHAIVIWRNMKFKEDLIINMSSSIASAVVGIGMAYMGYHYWSLVGMNFTTAIVKPGLCWYYSKWRPKLIFSTARFRRHFAFGSRMAFTSVLSVIYDNLTTIIVGRWFSRAELGYMNNAHALYIVPVSIIADPINKVTYPVLAKVQNDAARLRSGYRQVMRLLFQLSCPVMVTLAVLADPLYHFLYGDKWMVSASYFQVLCIAGVLFPINSYNMNLITVKGRSDLHLRLDITRKVVGLLCMFGGLPWGVFGIVCGYVASQVFNLFINTIYSGRFINFTLRQQLTELLPFFLMSLVSGLCVWVVDHFVMHSYGDFWRLAVGGIVMFLSYLAQAYSFMRQETLYIWSMVMHYVLRRG